MNDRIELAEKYYAVAQHLETQAQMMLETAKYLNSVADKLCEENMRLKQPSDSHSAGERREG